MHSTQPDVLLWPCPLPALLLPPVQALAKYAFGMGSLQVIITTLLFTAVALPAGSGLGTWFLEKVCNAPPSLVSIRTVDEVRACGRGRGQCGLHNNCCWRMACPMPLGSGWRFS